MKKLKVMTVVGTRPEIIRLSRVIAKLDQHAVLVAISIKHRALRAASLPLPILRRAPGQAAPRVRLDKSLAASQTRKGKAGDRRGD